VPLIINYILHICAFEKLIVRSYNKKIYYLSRKPRFLVAVKILLMVSNQILMTGVKTIGACLIYF